MTIPLKAAATGAARTARIDRVTRETSISVEVNLDGTGRAELATGVPFLDHMLDQVARHGMIDLTVSAKGDLHIDGHHTVEDVGITFGQAVKQALGDKAGLMRYGYAYVPLDEALSRVVVDPLHPSTLYAASEYAGVWRSTDGARHWHWASTGLTFRALNCRLGLLHRCRLLEQL